MPRLTNTDYIAAHDYLHQAWKRDDAIFALLSVTDQWVLHDYFVPTKRLSRAELLAHRTLMTKASPSLPQRAGKVLVRCRRDIEEAGRVAVAPRLKSGARHRSARAGHRIIVRGVAKPQPDVTKLVALLIQLAREQKEREEQ